MIHRVRGRQAFVGLRRGQRASAGGLWLAHVRDATPDVRIAFAIGREVGSAVARNRARRQLRAVWTDVADTHPEIVHAGDYLLGIREAPFESVEARGWLIRALTCLHDSPGSRS